MTSFYEDMGQVYTFLNNATDAFSWAFSTKTYNRIKYLTHLQKAGFTNPPYKIRKCHMRNLVRRRQAARRRYL